VSTLPLISPSAQKTTMTPHRASLLAVRPGVGDVAREPARVVAEENLEGAGLSVREHPGEVGPPERVLARHEIDVLAPGRAQPVALGERRLLGALDLGAVTVRLAACRLADVTRPSLAFEIVGPQVDGAREAHARSSPLARNRRPIRVRQEMVQRLRRPGLRAPGAMRRPSPR
jgi:hypothetical protein